MDARSMAQIFHPATNPFARATIFGAVFILAGIAWAASVLVRSSYVTQVDEVRDQPVPFSHDHHVSGLGLDCRYCHTSVEKSASAGLPSTEICMNCHSQIWRDSPLLEPVRESFRTGQPLHWTRVNNVADYVYFNHSIHVAKGIGCESCHGRVDRMPLMRKVVSMHMEWCLECHRHPELAVRPQEDVFKFGYRHEEGLTLHDEGTFRSSEEAYLPHIDPETPTRTLESPHSAELVKQYGIATKQLTDCFICHR
jgi:hypothetical protein